MNDLIVFLGDRSLPYRKIMDEHKDFFVQNMKIPAERVIIAEQTHSDNVHVCSEDDCGAGFGSHPQIEDCDALISDQPNQFLLIRTADCYPILLYDTKTQAIGAVHSGREGTRKNVTGKTVQAMCDTFQCSPSEIKVWVGAGICKRHYTVSSSVWEEFYQSCRHYNPALTKEDFPYLDLKGIILQQLYQAAILPQNVTSIPACTYEKDNYFSYRRDKTHNRQINLIGISDGKYHI
ncbi:MAG: peptidoglycan editing factor PgeF [Candidatus Cloacimonadaceae bacterium]